MVAGLRVLSRRSQEQEAGGIVVSLVCAVALAAVCEHLLRPASVGTALTAAVLAANSGALFVKLWAAKAGRPQGEALEKADAAQLPEASLRTAFVSLSLDWQPLLGACASALAFGLGWALGGVAEDATVGIWSTVGRTVGTVVLLGLFACSPGPGAAAATFPFVVAASAVLSVAVELMSSSPQPAPLPTVLANAAQMTFFALFWIEALYTGRDYANPELLPSLGAVVFFAAFVLGGMVGRSTAPEYAQKICAAAFLALLAAMLFRALWRAALVPGGPAITGPSSNAGGFDEVCRVVGEQYGLSPRESEILPLLVMGLSSPAIGERLFISPQTVKSHTHRIYVKMDIHTHDELSALFEQASLREGVRL